MNVHRKNSDGADDTRRGVDAFCELAGWTRHDLAERLGVGESVFAYYEYDTAPRWLALALIGLAVSELGIPVTAARDLIGELPAQVAGAG